MNIILKGRVLTQIPSSLCPWFQPYLFNYKKVHFSVRDAIPSQLSIHTLLSTPAVVPNMVARLTGCIDATDVVWVRKMIERRHWRFELPSWNGARCVVERERVGTAFRYFLNTLFHNKVEAVSKWLVFWCVPTSFMLVLQPWMELNFEIIRFLYHHMVRYQVFSCD